MNENENDFFVSMKYLEIKHIKIELLASFFTLIFKYIDFFYENY